MIPECDLLIYSKTSRYVDDLVFRAKAFNAIRFSGGEMRYKEKLVTSSIGSVFMVDFCADKSQGWTKADAADRRNPVFTLQVACTNFLEISKCSQPR